MHHDNFASHSSAGQPASLGVPESLHKSICNELTQASDRLRDHSLKANSAQYRSYVLHIVTALEHHLQKHGYMDYDPEWKHKGIFLREENLALKEENFELKKRVWEQERAVNSSTQAASAGPTKQKETRDKSTAIHVAPHCGQTETNEMATAGMSVTNVIWERIVGKIHAKQKYIESYFDKIEQDVRELKQKVDNPNSVLVLLEKIRIYKSRTVQKLTSLRASMSTRDVHTDCPHQSDSDSDSDAESAKQRPLVAVRRNVFDRSDPDRRLEPGKTLLHPADALKRKFLLGEKKVGATDRRSAATCTATSSPSPSASSRRKTGAPRRPSPKITTRRTWTTTTCASCRPAGEIRSPSRAKTASSWST